MNKLPFLFVLTISLTLIAGCTTKQARLPIRIGLIADSQITSPNSTPECIYRNKDADKELGKLGTDPSIDSREGQKVERENREDRGRPY